MISKERREELRRWMRVQSEDFANITFGDYNGRVYLRFTRAEILSLLDDSEELARAQETAEFNYAKATEQSDIAASRWDLYQATKAQRDAAEAKLTHLRAELEKLKDYTFTLAAVRDKICALLENK